MKKCTSSTLENGGFCEEDLYGFCYYCQRNMCPTPTKKECSCFDGTHITPNKFCPVHGAATPTGEQIVGHLPDGRPIIAVPTGEKEDECGCNDITRPHSTKDHQALHTKTQGIPTPEGSVRERFEEIVKNTNYNEYMGGGRFCCGGDYCNAGQGHNGWILSFIEEEVERSSNDAYSVGIIFGEDKGRTATIKELKEKAKSMKSRRDEDPSGFYNQALDDLAASLEE